MISYSGRSDHYLRIIDTVSPRLTLRRIMTHTAGENPANSAPNKLSCFGAEKWPVITFRSAVVLMIIPHWYVHAFLRMRDTSESMPLRRNSFTDLKFSCRGVHEVIPATGEFETLPNRRSRW